jgi:3-oxoacyl-[acyl-carrier protein] reductase
MDLGIQGRRAIVTGASKGLGRACATSLAQEGVEVWITARTKETLEETAREIAESTGGTVHAVPGDITTEEGRATVLQACPEPDILVANPGVKQTPDDFRTMSRADWDFWMEAHFYSTLDLIRAVAPGMCERRFGRILSMSVSFIKFPQVNFAASHSARLGLSGAIASMVRELIPHNVTINTVAPGLFSTEALHTNLHAHAKRGNTTYEAIVEDRKKGCPAGRFAEPSECGDLVAYICAAQSGFMSGQNIINDGGVYQGLF